MRKVFRPAEKELQKKHIAKARALITVIEGRQ
jgi:hypothetical protein